MTTAVCVLFASRLQQTVWSRATCHTNRLTGTGRDGAVTSVEGRQNQFSTFPILVSFFQPFVTGSDESGWNHVTDKSAYPTLTLLRSSFTAQPSSALRQVWLTAFVLHGLRLSFSHELYCMIPTSDTVINLLLCKFVQWIARDMEPHT